MVNKKRGIIIAAIVAIFSFITVAYISCTKPAANMHSCEGVLCNNGGYCYTDSATKLAKCVCPTGFEGVDCSIPIANKYFDTWDVTQENIGHDSALGPRHSDTFANYSVNLVRSATPTTFFINSFSGNPYYNQIVCTIDRNNSSYFSIDTISAFHMVFNNYRIEYGYGSIIARDSLIRAIFAVKHYGQSSNWRHDTFSLVMTRHR